VPTLKKQGFQINKLIVYLKDLAKQQQSKPKITRYTQIIKSGYKLMK
jgi:hypothetical protein